MSTLRDKFNFLCASYYRCAYCAKFMLSPTLCCGENHADEYLIFNANEREFKKDSPEHDAAFVLWALHSEKGRNRD